MIRDTQNKSNCRCSWWGELKFITQLLVVRVHASTRVSYNSSVSCTSKYVFVFSRVGYTYITMYKCVLLAHRHFFSSGRGSFLVLSAPWHAGGPPGPRAQVWALAEVRSTWPGGSKWQVPSGRDSEHVEPGPCKPKYRLKKCPTAHVKVKRMSDGSCDTWDLQCRHIVRHYLVMERLKECPTAHVQVKRTSDGSCDAAVLSRIAVRAWYNVTQ